VKHLQTPVPAVKHRREYPGGESAYKQSTPPNLYLAEVPIDTSISLLSGKYKEVAGTTTYNYVRAGVQGRSLGEGLGCDDCFGSITRIKISARKSTVQLKHEGCRKNGFYSPDEGREISGQFKYESELNDFNNDDPIQCPGENFSLESLIGQLRPAGKSFFNLSFRMIQTGYASKPFYHDYFIGIDRSKGTGAQVAFQIGTFSYQCEYAFGTSQYSNGFPDTCSAGIVNETFSGFTVVFS